MAMFAGVLWECFDGNVCWCAVGEKQCSVHGTGEHWDAEQQCVTGTVEMEPDTHIKLIRKGIVR